MPRGVSARSRRDSNHAALVKYIRSYPGMAFCDTAEIAGALDGIVGYRGIDCRIEFKDGALAPSRRRLTELEQETFDTWPGMKPRLIENTSDVDFLRHEMGMRAEWLSEGRRRMRD